MKQLNKSLFLFFLPWGLLVFSGIRIGPINFRNLISIILLFIFFLSSKRFHFNKVFKYYLVFLVTFSLSCLINGQFFTHVFARSILGGHLCSVSIVLSFSVLLKDRRDIEVIIKSLSVLFVINGIISFLQYLNIPFGWDIAKWLVPENRELVEDAEEYILRHEMQNSLGVSLAPGLLGFVVTNGYFCAGFAPLLLLKFWDSNSVSGTIKCILVLAFSIIVIFAIQQRMALICFFVLLVIWVDSRLKSVPRVLYLLLFMFMAVLFFPLISGFDAGRFSRSLDNSDRIALFNDFIFYIKRGNLLFGGDIGLGQHNTFLNVWTRGGLFSLFFFIPFFFNALHASFSSFRDGTRCGKIMESCLALSCLFFLLYSQTHSTGLESGSVLFWLPCMLLFSCQSIDKGSLTVK